MLSLKQQHNCLKNRPEVEVNVQWTIPGTAVWREKRRGRTKKQSGGQRGDKGDEEEGFANRGSVLDKACRAKVLTNVCCVENKKYTDSEILTMMKLGVCVLPLLLANIY